MEKGIESLKAAILKDTVEGENCFNENGCDHEFTRTVPAEPNMLKHGFKTSCVRVSKCFHKYCDKYKWVMDRAKHYSERNGKSVEEIIKVWEDNRSYSYMNYYQGGNMPLSGIPINDDRVLRLNIRVNVLQNEIKTYSSILPTLTEEYQESVKKEIEDKINKLQTDLEYCNARLGLYEVSFFQ